MNAVDEPPGVLNARIDELFDFLGSLLVGGFLQVGKEGIHPKDGGFLRRSG